MRLRTDSNCDDRVRFTVSATLPSRRAPVNFELA